VGIGDGTGSDRRPDAAPRRLACVLRAGVVARERVTAFEGRDDGRDLPRTVCLDRGLAAARVGV
jgi:hypothetical protein